MTGRAAHSWVAWLVVLALSLYAPVKTADAAMAEPQPIEGPLPETWRTPLREYLAKQGLPDAQSVIDDTKTAPLPVWTRENQFAQGLGLLLQIQSPATCSANRDQCLTIVGRVDRDVFVADLTFFAGTEMNIFDVFMRLPDGLITTKMVFHSRDVVIGLRKAPIGWILDAARQTEPAK
jgi:hypothetical protein